MNKKIMLSPVITLALVANAKSLKNILEIPVTTMQKLSLDKALETGRPSYIYAASGIVEHQNKFFMISDDELSIFQLKESDKNLTPFTLSKQQLSAIPKIRKKFKPDFEALVTLNEKQWPPNGALVVWPSGSSHQRMIAVIIPFTKTGDLAPPLPVDISGLTEILSQSVRDLNIEGLMIDGSKILLIQRGNSAKNKSGIFEVDLAPWIEGLKTNKWKVTASFKKIKLGKLAGITLTLSDLIATPYGLIGLAAAEDSKTTVSDGHVEGTVLLKVKDNKATILGKFAPKKKFEGLVARPVKDGLDLFLVDDGDSAEVPSYLYRAHVSKTELEK